MKSLYACFCNRFDKVAWQNAVAKVTSFSLYWALFFTLTMFIHYKLTAGRNIRPSRESHVPLWSGGCMNYRDFSKDEGGGYWNLMGITRHDTCFPQYWEILKTNFFKKEHVTGWFQKKHTSLPNFPSVHALIVIRFCTENPQINQTWQRERFIQVIQ